MAAKTRSKRSDGIKTKEKILDAALSVAADKGLKGLTHREIANRAGVSLALTTYHFDSITDLAIQAYKKFQGITASYTSSSMTNAFALVDQYSRLTSASHADREILVDNLAKQIAKHIYEQVTQLKKYRYMEAAFMHFGLSSEGIKSDIMETRESFCKNICGIFRLVGSKHAEADASNLLSAIYYQETHSLLSSKRVDTKKAYKDVHRLLSLTIPDISSGN